MCRSAISFRAANGFASSSCSNTTPGQPDGEQAFWIDSALQGHWKGFNWRKAASLQANALTLESYVTGNWTKNPTNVVSFENVVIARRYIGPTTPR